MPLKPGSNERRTYERELYAARYHFEEGFAEKEAARKKSWYERNREKVIAKVLARRAELKAGK